MITLKIHYNDYPYASLGRGEPQTCTFTATFGHKDAMEAVEEESRQLAIKFVENIAKRGFLQSDNRIILLFHNILSVEIIEE